jgi:hypothetical protein
LPITSPEHTKNDRFGAKAVMYITDNGAPLVL